jgi:hypothetical protein
VRWSRRGGWSDLTRRCSPRRAPGNAASLRALLAAGFRPIGSEVLFFDGERPPG